MVKNKQSFEEFYESFAMGELVHIGMGPNYTRFYRKDYRVTDPALSSLQSAGLIRKANSCLALSNRKYDFYSLTPYGREVYDGLVEAFKKRLK